jgi:2-oxoglutarate dehydrogenase E2 component (dihydrolipoamide succinyltransferase)
MPVPLKVPSLGESVTQATVGAWLKQPGEAVAVDEPVVEVESEKATVAVPAPAAGRLGRVLRSTGESVAVGEVLAEVEEGAAAEVGGGGPAPAATARPGVNGAPAPAAADAKAPAAAARAPAPPATAPAPAVAAPLAPVASLRRASPSARRRMAEQGGAPEDAGAEAARGPAIAPLPTGPAGEVGERERLVPMTTLRRTVARRLVEAQHTAAILTTFNEVDMSRVMALRERHGEAFQARHGVKLGFMSFFVKAAVEALRTFPAVNAEVRGEAVVYKDHYDVGVAVGGGKGLVVPVVRDADARSFAELEKEIAELARKARENRLSPDELSGGTFTISNGGVYGSLLSTPILNPPQSGILGLHKIQKRPVVGEGDQVVVRPMMYLALSYDHRLVDGREAVSFLVRVKEAIEDPERLLLEV